MIYRIDTIANSGWIQTLYNYLSNYIEGLSYDSGTDTLTFFNKFSYYITSNHIHLKYESLDVDLGGGWDIGGGSISFTFILTDNFMYLNGIPNGGDGRITISYLKDAQENYYASGADYRGSLKSIYDLIYYNTSESSTAENYTMPKAINCNSSVGKIYYSNRAIIIHGSSITTVIPNICSCSNVTRFSTVTINGSNYFAIDTNNLVLVD